MLRSNNVNPDSGYLHSRTLFDITMIKHKKCKCAEDYWEEIVVQNDENYKYETVLYFHCDFCGEDFRVENYETGNEVFYYSEKKS